MQMGEAVKQGEHLRGGMNMKRVLYEMERVKGVVTFSPVSEYNTMNFMEEGDYLVKVRPGLKTIKRVLKPDYAAVEAAIMDCEAAMEKAMVKATEPRGSVKLTPKEQAAFEQFKKDSGIDSITWTRTSTWEIVDAGLCVLREKLQKAVT